MSAVIRIGLSRCNEPLTTARFSALYGAWYPHAKDDALFSRAVVNRGRRSYS